VCQQHQQRTRRPALGRGQDAETVTDLQGPHNDDLWDCLPDGTDPDLQSDGCIRIATLNDLTAEWTGHL